MGPLSMELPTDVLARSRCPPDMIGSTSGSQDTDDVISRADRELPFLHVFMPRGNGRLTDPKRFVWRGR